MKTLIIVAIILVWYATGLLGSKIAHSYELSRYPDVTEDTMIKDDPFFWYGMALGGPMSLIGGSLAVIIHK